MALDKKFVEIVYQGAKESKAEAFGSIVIENLKGGVIYKTYHKMIDSDKFEPLPKYIKLVFPSGTQIIVPQDVPIKKLEEALLKSREVQMVRYEFLSHNHIMLKYLYIFKIGNEYYDLPEDMAQRIVKDTGITLQIYS
ncbi:MAG: hypothetical protein V1866_03270 [archaeon]